MLRVVCSLGFVAVSFQLFDSFFGTLGHCFDLVCASMFFSGRWNGAGTLGSGAPSRILFSKPEVLCQIERENDDVDTLCARRPSSQPDGKLKSHG